MILLRTAPLKLKFPNIKEAIKVTVPKNIKKFDAKLKNKKIQVLGILKSVKIPKKAVEENKKEGSEHNLGFTLIQKNGDAILFWLECEKYEVAE